MSKKKMYAQEDTQDQQGCTRGYTRPTK